MQGLPSGSGLCGKGPAVGAARVGVAGPSAPTAECAPVEVGDGPAAMATEETEETATEGHSPSGKAERKGRKARRGARLQSEWLRPAADE